MPAARTTDTPAQLARLLLPYNMGCGAFAAQPAVGDSELLNVCTVSQVPSVSCSSKRRLVLRAAPSVLPLITAS